MKRFAICAGHPEGTATSFLIGCLQEAGHEVEVWREPEDVHDQVDLMYYRESGPPEARQAATRAALRAQEIGVRSLNGPLPRPGENKQELYRRWMDLPILPWQMADEPRRLTGAWTVVRPCWRSNATLTENGMCRRFEDFDEAQSFARTMDGPALLQPFQAGMVVRVLATPERVLTSYLKWRQDGRWDISSFNEGSQRLPFKMSPDQETLVCEAVERLDGDLLGIEIIASGRRSWLLDANATPYIAPESLGGEQRRQLVEVFEQSA